MPATSPARRKRRKEARPAELLDAAIALFVAKGYAATRLEDIAASASVSKGTLYRYYANKEALFKAVIQEGVVPVIIENEAIAASHTGNSFDLLSLMLDNWWTKIGQTAFAGIPKLMVAEAENFPDLACFYFENVISRVRALVGSALRRGMASGEFREMDVETTIDVVIAPVLMLLIWQFSLNKCLGGESHPVPYLAIHRDLLKQGLRKPEKKSQV